MNAERLLEVYNQISEAPDAITRLRRFILDLAVRGKLVEQDGRDEPASVQSNRIAAAKAKLNIKVGKTKKKLVDPSLTEISFKLPPGWTVSRFADLVRVLNGRAYKKPELLSEGTPVLRVGNLFTSDHWYYSDLKLEEDKYCDEGDLIFAWSASFGPFIWSGPKVIYHYHIWKLPLFCEANLSKRYIYLYLQQKTREIKDAGHGVSMIHMTKEKMEQLAVPLPPLAEQHRIVAKVEELMGLCDQLEEARKTREETRDKLTAASLARLTAASADTAEETSSSEAYEEDDFASHARFALETLPALTAHPDQIKALRQTILNLAVRGKLVEQDPDDETAKSSLDGLKQAAKHLFQEEGLRARKPVAHASRRDLKFEIPRSWELTIFDDVFVMVSGVTKGGKVPAQDSQVRPYLRVANVQRGHLDLGVIKTIEVKSADAERYRLKDGDILMTEGGDWDKLGRAAIWRCQIDDCIHQNHVFRVRSPSDDVVAEWVVTYVNSELGRAFFEEASKQTTNLASINMTQLRGCPLPLPPLAEQHCIVAKVDELMALCDRLEAALTEADTKRARLLEALLHEALQPAEAELEAAE